LCDWESRVQEEFDLGRDDFSGALC